MYAEYACVHKSIFMFSNNLFTNWRITMTPKLFPHILSLVIAVERKSGPAVWSLILLKL